ncbi:hypothetical protein D3C81_845840 [compost metagenome]
MGNRGDGFIEQADGVCRGVGLAAIADGEVDAVRTQVADLVARGEPYVELRMGALQAAQARQQPQPGHADAGRHGHRLAAIAPAQFAGHVLELLHGAVGAAEQPLALGREGHAAMLAHEQAHLQMVFQRADLPADGGLRQAQVVGGLGDAHAPANGHEALEQIEREQPGERDGHGGMGEMVCWD